MSYKSSFKTNVTLPPTFLTVDINAVHTYIYIVQLNIIICNNIGPFWEKQMFSYVTWNFSLVLSVHEQKKIIPSCDLNGQYVHFINLLSNG